VEAAQTRYVERPDGVAIAYQVIGDGPVDVLYVPGFVSHLDLSWSEPSFVRMLTRLASFARVIIYDKPGTGISDPIDHLPLVEERAQDALTVLDAAGSERPVLLGFSEGGSTCLLIAATSPERIAGVVTYGALVKGRPSAQELERMGLTQEEVDAKWAAMHDAIDDWGSGRTADLLFPSIVSPMERRFWSLFERAAASPKMVRGLISATEQTDVTAVLPSIRLPVLVLHRTGDFVPVAHARLLAQGISGARLVALPGDDHALWKGDMDTVLNEIEEFVTGSRSSAQPDRALSTVLFSDVVGSTARAAQAGDAAWRRELEALDAQVGAVASAHGGRVVKSLGDGHLVELPGPGRAVQAALSLHEASTLPLRIGVHTGECERIGDDLGGLAVHIGARIATLATEGEVLVSRTVKDLLVGSAVGFRSRGEHVLKGVPGEWELYAVLGGRSAERVLAAQRELRAGDRTALRMARTTPWAVRRLSSLAQRWEAGTRR
jgi:class 3 adenylate cyclase